MRGDGGAWSSVMREAASEGIAGLEEDEAAEDDEGSDMVWWAGGGFN